jgi:FdhD protein
MSTLVESAQLVPTVRVTYEGDIRTADTRSVPVECPLEIVYGTIPYAVMMVTPADLEDFVRGFSLTEGVIVHGSDLRGIAIEQHPKGLRALVDLEPKRLSAHLARKRAMTGRTGCGVCGIEDLNALPDALVSVPASHPITASALAHAVATLPFHQPLNDLTHAVHAAAWFDRDGAFMISREDVGRHNALDKLIGALLLNGTDPSTGFLLITSRCSYEMVEKAAIFGISTLVAISAPTSLAIERAAALGLTLYAIARADGATQFTHQDQTEILLEKCA